MVVIRLSIDSYERTVLAQRGTIAVHWIACVRKEGRGLGSVRAGKGGHGP